MGIKNLKSNLPVTKSKPPVGRRVVVTTRPGGVPFHTGTVAEPIDSDQSVIDYDTVHAGRPVAGGSGPESDDYLASDYKDEDVDLIRDHGIERLDNGKWRHQEHDLDMDEGMEKARPPEGQRVGYYSDEDDNDSWVEGVVRQNDPPVQGSSPRSTVDFTNVSGTDTTGAGISGSRRDNQLLGMGGGIYDGEEEKSDWMDLEKGAVPVGQRAVISRPYGRRGEKVRGTVIESDDNGQVVDIDEGPNLPADRRFSVPDHSIIYTDSLPENVANYKLDEEKEFPGEEALEDHRLTPRTTIAKPYPPPDGEEKAEGDNFGAPKPYHRKPPKTVGDEAMDAELMPPPGRTQKPDMNFGGDRSVTNVDPTDWMAPFRGKKPVMNAESVDDDEPLGKPASSSKPKTEPMTASSSPSVPLDRTAPLRPVETPVGDTTGGNGGEEKPWWEDGGEDGGEDGRAPGDEKPWWEVNESRGSGESSMGGDIWPKAGRTRSDGEDVYRPPHIPKPNRSWSQFATDNLSRAARGARDLWNMDPQDVMDNIDNAMNSHNDGAPIGTPEWYQDREAYARQRDRQRKEKPWWLFGGSRKPDKKSLAEVVEKFAWMPPEENAAPSPKRRKRGRELLAAPKDQRTPPEGLIKSGTPKKRRPQEGDTVRNVRTGKLGRHGGMNELGDHVLHIDTAGSDSSVPWNYDDDEIARHWTDEHGEPYEKSDHPAGTRVRVGLIQNEGKPPHSDEDSQLAINERRSGHNRGRGFQGYEVDDDQNGVDQGHTRLRMSNGGARLPMSDRMIAAEEYQADHVEDTQQVWNEEQDAIRQAQDEARSRLKGDKSGYDPRYYGESMERIPHRRKSWEKVFEDEYGTKYGGDFKDPEQVEVDDDVDVDDAEYEKPGPYRDFSADTVSNIDTHFRDTMDHINEEYGPGGIHAPRKWMNFSKAFGSLAGMPCGRGQTTANTGCVPTRPEVTPDIAAASRDSAQRRPTEEEQTQTDGSGLPPDMQMAIKHLEEMCAKLYATATDAAGMVIGRYGDVGSLRQEMLARIMARASAVKMWRSREQPDDLIRASEPIGGVTGMGSLPISSLMYVGYALGNQELGADVVGRVRGAREATGAGAGSNVRTKAAADLDKTNPAPPGTYLDQDEGPDVLTPSDEDVGLQGEVGNTEDEQAAWWDYTDLPETESETSNRLSDETRAATRRNDFARSTERTDRQSSGIWTPEQIRQIRGESKHPSWHMPSPSDNNLGETVNIGRRKARRTR